MTTIFRSALFALVLAAAGWHALFAADPAPTQTTGRVLILANARILEGDIERFGDQYRVKYAVGETWVPADQVRRLCADMADAYVFLRGQANLSDPDEHLRLAQWCRVHALQRQALAEAAEAVNLRPSHVESRRLLASLQRSEDPSPAPDRHAAEAEPNTPQAVEYNTESLGLFVTRVQPILMNACANCHAAGGRGGPSFHLTRAYANELTNRRATQQNLAAVLAQVNRKQPETSVLLSRAVTVHGEATQAPLKGRQAAAFKTLEEWVQLAVTNGPHEKPAAAPATVPPAAVSENPATRPTFASNPTPAPTPEKPVEGGPLPRQAPMPSPSPDPFDPMLFNGQTPPPAERPGPK